MTRSTCSQCHHNRNDDDDNRERVASAITTDDDDDDDANGMEVIVCPLTSTSPVPHPRPRSPGMNIPYPPPGRQPVGPVPRHLSARRLRIRIGIFYDRYGSLDHAEEAFASILKMDKGWPVAPSLWHLIILN